MYDYKIIVLKILSYYSDLLSNSGVNIKNHKQCIDLVYQIANPIKLKNAM